MLCIYDLKYELSAYLNCCVNSPVHGEVRGTDSRVGFVPAEDFSALLLPQV